MFKRKTQGVEDYTYDEGGLGWFERGASSSFPSVLAWSCYFLNVNGLLWSVYEVPVALPGMSGVPSRCCSMLPGGSSRQSENWGLECRYCERHILFKQKSVI